MMFPPDYFTSSTDQSIPEESPHHYRQDTPPKEPRSKRRKSTTGRKTMPPSRTPVPDPNSGNEYSKIMLLGFTLIKFFFFFIAGLVIAYVFTWFFDQDLASSLLGFGIQFLRPLIVCVSCIVAIVIIIESFR